MNMGAGVQLPEYRCHKVVRAAKITGIKTDGFPYRAELKFDHETRIQHGVMGANTAELTLGEIGGLWTTTVKWCQEHKVEEGGYLVEYEDGYRSYSPAKAFEEGYTKIEPCQHQWSTRGPHAEPGRCMKCGREPT